MHKKRIPLSLGYISCHQQGKIPPTREVAGEKGFCLASLKLTAFSSG